MPWAKILTGSLWLLHGEESVGGRGWKWGDQLEDYCKNLRKCRWWLKPRWGSVEHGGENSAKPGYLLKTQLTGLTSSPRSELWRVTKFDIRKAKLTYSWNFLNTLVRYYKNSGCFMVRRSYHSYSTQNLKFCQNVGSSGVHVRVALPPPKWTSAKSV